MQRPFMQALKHLNIGINLNRAVLVISTQMVRTCASKPQPVLALEVYNCTHSGPASVFRAQTDS